MSITAPVTSTPAPISPSTGSDSASREWLARLRSSGPEKQAADAELHNLLLRAARFEIGRRQGALEHVRGEDLDDLAQQAADDACVAVLSKLDSFRGESRFTTWAYKFALLEAGVRLRRRAWQEREVTLEPEIWPVFSDRGASPHDQTQTSELMDAISRSVEESLTPHQRNVLLALAVNGVPIDVLAERLSTTRGALYKTLHDARRKLRADLEAKGFETDATNGRER
ncbi:MAG TPA: sigma-70 family RNA polymerase sigma factor [Thermoleophilaceae bacterium]|nr:sigma-70 family RNA polymerase sigma factor [Thermoleophilaceae bacterium]